MIRAARWVFASLAACTLLAPSSALAAGKISLYVSRMDPTDVDANRFSRTSWGGGICGVLPAPVAHNLVALTTGLEISNMMSRTTKVYDPILNETLEQNTSQSYGRVFLGTRLGPHGSGFLRPHVGANLAVVWYGISTDVLIPDQANPGQFISHNVDSNTKGAFGYDVNAGLDLNIGNRVPVEIGVRHVQSLNVPQPLGEGSVSVSPSYFQIYFGVGMNLEVFHHQQESPIDAPAGTAPEMGEAE
jgi:hypothetical protein